MPSAAVRAEQKFQDGMEPLKQVLILVEKKVRNLEKRKGKLEDYKAKEKKGEVLTDEQKNASSRLEEVNQHLEMAKDLQKQFTAVSQEAEKNLKRQLKKEKAEKHEEERKRLGEVLQFKSLVDCLRNDPARTAFLQGVDGAAKVTDEELAMVEEFYKLVFTERTKEDNLGDHMQAASEHLQNLLDGKDKAVNGLQAGVSYKQLKEFIDKVDQSPYFIGSPEAEETKECAEETSSNNTVEQDFVIVKTGDVPAPESPEVTASLPPVQEPENQEESDEQYPIDESITIYNQRVEKAFQEIVTSGKINFLQDSLIDIDAPAHSDPAVLQVLPQQSSYVTSLHSGNPASYTVSGSYNSYVPALPEQTYSPDAPQPIPLPSHDSGIADDSKFTMNADAPAFETKTQPEGDGDNGFENDGFHQTGRNSRGRFQNGGRGRGRPNGYRNNRGGNSRGNYQNYQPRPDYNTNDGVQTFNGGSNVPNYRRGSGGSRGYGSKDFQPRGQFRGGRVARGSYQNESQQRPALAEAEA